MERPNVDVVVPFAGATSQLNALLHRLAGLERRDGDTVTLVDDRRLADRRLPPVPHGVAVMPTARRRGSYHARNEGARRGTAPWLLFLDADVRPIPSVLDQYFAPPPEPRAAVLAGGVRDLPAAPGSPVAVRYTCLKSSMSHEPLLARGRWAFAQTANCAVRRSAFDAAGGFREVRSGGDADLCFRLVAAGWEIAARPKAAVLHLSRKTLRAMLAQRARHGAGAAWLEREHPGALPRRRWPGLALWSARRMGTGLAGLARGDRDAALVGLLDGPATWAFELGRLLPNGVR